jgi:hypothetical protein
MKRVSDALANEHLTDTSGRFDIINYFGSICPAQRRG